MVQKFSLNPQQFLELRICVLLWCGCIVYRREGGSLVTSGLFSLVRHPMYTSILLCIWSNPTMVQYIGSYQVNIVADVMRNWQ